MCIVHCDYSILVRSILATISALFSRIFSPLFFFFFVSVQFFPSLVHIEDIRVYYTICGGFQFAQVSVVYVYSYTKCFRSYSSISSSRLLTVPALLYRCNRQPSFLCMCMGVSVFVTKQFMHRTYSRTIIEQKIVVFLKAKCILCRVTRHKEIFIKNYFFVRPPPVSCITLPIIT